MCGDVKKTRRKVFRRQGRLNKECESPTVNPIVGHPSIHPFEKIKMAEIRLEPIPEACIL